MKEAMTCPSDLGYLLNRKGEPYARVQVLHNMSQTSFVLTDGYGQNIGGIVKHYFAENMADNKALEKIVNKLV